MSGQIGPGTQFAALALGLIAAGGAGGWLLGPRSLRMTAHSLMLAGWLGLLILVAPRSGATQGSVLAAAVGIALVGFAFVSWRASRADTRVLTISRSVLDWLAVAAAATLAVRVPVPTGGETYNLLVPLYAVIGAGMTARLAVLVAPGPALPHRAGEQIEADGEGLAPDADEGSALHTRLIDSGVVATVAVAVASTAWTFDIEGAVVALSMFYVPFLLLYTLLRGRLLHLRLAAVAFLVVMTVAALAGIVQRLTHTIWQNPKIEVANEFAPNFRTNSIFWDPNIYGRYLVAALLLVLCLVLFRTLSARISAGAVAVGALLATALWFTYSQSSLLAFSAACLLLSLFAVRRRAAGATLAIFLLFVAAAIPTGALLGVFDDDERLAVAEGGITLASIQPVRGLGLSSFDKAYVALYKEEGQRAPKLRESHTTPVTVAVELGLLGLGAYLLLLVGLLVGAAQARLALLRTAPLRTTQQWAAAVACAAVVHSLFYAGFFEDPLTWLAAALLATSVPRS